MGRILRGESDVKMGNGPPRGLPEEIYRNTVCGVTEVCPPNFPAVDKNGESTYH